MDTKPTYLLGYLYGPLILKWKQYLFKSEILLLNLAWSSPITTKIALDAFGNINLLRLYSIISKTIIN